MFEGRIIIVITVDRHANADGERTPVAAAALASMHLPKLDGDLITAAKETVRFWKIYTIWPKIGLPIAAVWFGLFILESLKGRVLPASDVYLFVASLVVFAVLGVVFGLKHLRNLLDATDDLLSQIEQLRKGSN